MLIKNPLSWQLKENQATPETIYKQRRDIVKKLGLAAAITPFTSNAQASLFDVFSAKKDPVAVIDPRQDLVGRPSSLSTSDLELTPEPKVLTYNNFYEFGSSKGQPAELAKGFETRPWTIEITGEVAKSVTLDIDDVMKNMTIEERIYRHRCVEAWSMNVPWLGFTLASLLKLVQPTSKAKYVAFETLYDPKKMPGQASYSLGGGIDYPYVEGLTIEEAMNPLTLMTVGLYGKTLAPQNGAPLRLIVPWKYGFKGIKSIVKIHLLEQQPPTTWNLLAAEEYGFYANVNPNVDHPRWSQASERFIGEGSLFSSRRQKTLMFNGYGEQVASLYKNLDLTKNY
ncbi:protein-methionine-sulfoxide reductase catalytic subunit MsrP [Vibrio sp. S11_S32]|uniref:protein-methionine-sulfoxide reductase catalytic subunit MsrP n=1 Tax=Vibrio sp. S11_S32 TaxID=2720225 RepID=UPI001680617D|nr:protein-methionine-sulfoxide reductase catalytic subunit MsrP [Vibrio sp. S11_S32]MBD1576636.1 protein-methionine-sulfoxide reductase catalytic subunit MsrP [Vibrio sp. S11_S32]